MELSPDIQPATDYAASAALLHPILLRNMGFWLLAMLLGSVFLLMLPGSTDKNGYGFVIAGLATILSLAALPLLLPLLPWALMAASAGLRWLRVFTLQSLSLSGLTALGYVLAGGSGHGGFGAGAPLVGTLYFGAGLLAAVAVYWPWLRCPQ